jgi:uncharacterized damage-inducible protein DinB
MFLGSRNGTAMARKTKAKASNASKPAARKKAARKPAARKAVAAAPSAKQQFLDSFERESAKTLQVLRALPAEQSELRPHARAKSARELAFTFIMEQAMLTKALTDQPMFTGGGMPPAPNDLQAILTQFQNDQRALLDLIRKTPDKKFSTTLQFPTGPGQMGDWSKMAFAWFILSDQIHHRGQFSVYVRMAGGKVPSIYGPSLDEPWR